MYKSICFICIKPNDILYTTYTSPIPIYPVPRANLCFNSALIRLLSFHLFYRRFPRCWAETDRGSHSDVRD